MIFSWRYFERVGTYYHALMLAFLAGMTGFCLTGDIFDLFVWFELMGVAAYALTAYRPEERGPIQGALNFAITNSIGAYLSLSGIALIYGRTGALNMAQIGRHLAGHRPDRLVVVAFLLIISGLLIKGAIVPFHFWLADAHAVAPTPVCVLFSGVMVELGLYGVARVYWSMFGQALGHRSTITAVFARPRRAHRNRGCAVLLPGTAPEAAAGVLHHQPCGHVPGRHRPADPARAGRHGRLRAGPRPGQGGAVPVRGNRAAPARLGERALAAQPRPPPAGHRRGVHAGRVRPGRPAAIHHLPGQGLDRGQRGRRGLAWIMPLFIACSVLVGGAVLRVAGGVFYGLGDPPSETMEMAKESSEETSETDEDKQRTPLSMIVPPAVLVAAAVVIGFLPRLGPADPGGRDPVPGPGRLQRPVLSGAHVAHPGRAVPAESAGITLSAVLTGLGSAAGAVMLAYLALYWRRLPLLRRGSNRAPGWPAHPAVPERRGERLRHLDRRRPGLPGRRARPRHPVMP